MRNFIGIGIAAVLLIGGFIFKDFLSGNAGDLKVGDCFDLPPANVETVEDVQHHPCDQDHGGEVVFVGDYPGSGSDPYPTDDQFISFLLDSCWPASVSYSGIDIPNQDVYDIGWFQPTDEGWRGGDQSVICYLYRLDEAPFKGSLKKS